MYAAKIPLAIILLVLQKAGFGGVIRSSKKFNNDLLLWTSLESASHIASLNWDHVTVISSLEVLQLSYFLLLNVQREFGKIQRCLLMANVIVIYREMKF